MSSQSVMLHALIWHPGVLLEISSESIFLLGVICGCDAVSRENKKPLVPCGRMDWKSSAASLVAAMDTSLSSEKNEHETVTSTSMRTRLKICREFASHNVMSGCADWTDYFEKMDMHQRLLFISMAYVRQYTP